MIDKAGRCLEAEGEMHQFPQRVSFHSGLQNEAETANPAVLAVDCHHNHHSSLPQHHDF